MPKLTELASWKALEAHFEQIKDVHMRDLFEQDAGRFKKFSRSLNNQGETVKTEDPTK